MSNFQWRLRMYWETCAWALDVLGLGAVIGLILWFVGWPIIAGIAVGVALAIAICDVIYPEDIETGIGAVVAFVILTAVFLGTWIWVGFIAGLAMAVFLFVAATFF